MIKEVDGLNFKPTKVVFVFCSIVAIIATSLMWKDITEQSKSFFVYSVVSTLLIGTFVTFLMTNGRDDEYDNDDNRKERIDIHININDKEFVRK